MPIRLLTDSGVRELDRSDFTEYLEDHPTRVVDQAFEVAAAGPHIVANRETLPFELGVILQSAVPSVWVVDADESDPLDPGPEEADYQFVPVPAAAQADHPVEFSSGGPSRLYSSYRSLLPDESGNLRETATGLLIELSTTNYDIRLPTDDHRSKRVGELLRTFQTLVAASGSFAIATTGNSARRLRLSPGGLPPELRDALLEFLQELRLDDVLDTEILAAYSGLIRAQEERREPDDVEAIVAGYRDASIRIERELGEELRSVARAVADGEPTNWWIPGDRLLDSAPLTSADLRRRGGNHLVVPGLPFKTAVTDATIVPDDVDDLVDEPVPSLGTPINPSNLSTTKEEPILGCLSDFHMGQGYWDNADDVYPALDAAYVSVIQSWGERVTEHRAEHGPHNRAFLILHGDHLDFWSADMRRMSGGGDRFVPDVRNEDGEPKVDKGVAGERMERIILAHKPFFDEVNSWVDENEFNFVIYVAGNHDDHLVRFNLGEDFADHLHMDRAVFSPDDVYFPGLRTLIEHGHREDEYNVPHVGLKGVLGSLGEIVVSMLINPVERGGANLVMTTAAEFDNNFLTDQGVDPDSTDDLQSAYSHLRECLEVDENTYEAYLGIIDNLDNAGSEDAVADSGGRELVWADRDAADAADVSDIDEDISELKGIWLSSEFQGLKGDLTALLQEITTPNLQTYLLNEVFASNQAEKLGFDPTRGLYKRYAKVHVVGHTHKPSLTEPALGTGIVPAQHINTGTGQDAWIGEDVYGWLYPDIFDLGTDPWSVQSSPDTLEPVQRSQYCLITRVYRGDVPFVRVEGGPFREVQSRSPKYKTKPLGGSMRGGTYNDVRL